MSFFKFSKPSQSWSPAGDGAEPREEAAGEASGEQNSDQGRQSPALAALRSQFGAPSGHQSWRGSSRQWPQRRQQAQEYAPCPPAPHVELPEGGTIVVRNCSTKRVLQLLIEEFGGRAENVSGRYFVPSVQDLPRIHDFARRNGFFVKESLVGKILVLDVMVDRAIRQYPQSFGGASRQWDDGEDERG